MVPSFVLAETNAGIKPGSIFYFFDTSLEKVSMFFTFNSEKKAEKALEYAEERFAEAQEVADENKPDAVAKAMADYEKKILFATEKSKDLDDKEKTERLLNTISENTARHQEVLENVLERVPDEAKEAILKAIEISKRGYEEAQKQVVELRREVDELRTELENLKEELEAAAKAKGRLIEEEEIISVQKKQSSNLPSSTYIGSRYMPRTISRTTQEWETQPSFFWSTPYYSEPTIKGYWVSIDSLTLLDVLLCFQK